MNVQHMRRLPPLAPEQAEAPQTKRAGPHPHHWPSTRAHVHHQEPSQLIPCATKACLLHARLPHSLPDHGRFRTVDTRARWLNVSRTFTSFIIHSSLDLKALLYLNFSSFIHLRVILPAPSQLFLPAPNTVPLDRPCFNYHLSSWASPERFSRKAMARTNRRKAMKSLSNTPATYMTSQRRIMTIEEPSKTTHGLLDWLLHGLIDACSIRFDSSVNRGDFKTKIGVGKVIRGMESSTYSLDHSRSANVWKVGTRVSRR